MAEGGLGIRDMVDFNIAGMMKLAWRILENPSSLNSSIWEAEERRGCSHAWKGILLRLFHLRGNVQWNIGQMVNFWKDPWFAGQSLSDSHDDNIQEYLGTVVGSKVSDFFRGVPQTWVLPYPTSVFLRNIWREVENYTLPIQPKKDSLIWIHSTDGSFSIKRAWNFIRHQGSSQPSFRVLWSSKCHPRTKWFS
ncbi:hypothetical protein AMTRI_Chr01g131760 [Amborella trichopoda]